MPAEFHNSINSTESSDLRMFAKEYLREFRNAPLSHEQYKQLMKEPERSDEEIAAELKAEEQQLQDEVNFMSAYARDKNSPSIPDLAQEHRLDPTAAQTLVEHVDSMTSGERELLTELNDLELGPEVIAQAKRLSDENAWDSATILSNFQNLSRGNRKIVLAMLLIGVLSAHSGRAEDPDEADETPETTHSVSTRANSPLATDSQTRTENTTQILRELGAIKQQAGNDPLKALELIGNSSVKFSPLSRTYIQDTIRRVLPTNPKKVFNDYSLYKSDPVFAESILRQASAALEPDPYELTYAIYNMVGYKEYLRYSWAGPVLKNIIEKLADTNLQGAIFTGIRMLQVLNASPNEFPQFSISNLEDLTKKLSNRLADEKAEDLIGIAGLLKPFAWSREPNGPLHRALSHIVKTQPSSALRVAREECVHEPWADTIIYEAVQQLLQHSVDEALHEVPYFADRTWAPTLIASLVSEHPREVMERASYHISSYPWLEQYVKQAAEILRSQKPLELFRLLAECFWLDNDEHSAVKNLGWFQDLTRDLPVEILKNSPEDFFKSFEHNEKERSWEAPTIKKLLSNRAVVTSLARHMKLDRTYSQEVAKEIIINYTDVFIDNAERFLKTKYWPELQTDLELAISRHPETALLQSEKLFNLEIPGWANKTIAVAAEKQPKAALLSSIYFRKFPETSTIIEKAFRTVSTEDPEFALNQWTTYQGWSWTPNAMKFAFEQWIEKDARAASGLKRLYKGQPWEKEMDEKMERALSSSPSTAPITPTRSR